MWQKHLIGFSLTFLWLLIKLHIFHMVTGDLYLPFIELLHVSFEQFSTKILTFSLLISWSISLLTYFTVILSWSSLQGSTYKANSSFVKTVLENVLCVYTKWTLLHKLNLPMHDGIYNTVFAFSGLPSDSCLHLHIFTSTSHNNPC